MVKNILLLFPVIFFAQKKDSNNAFFVGTSQGITFLLKESFSNTTKETFATGLGYAYKIEAGYSFVSKTRKFASDISVGVRSVANSVDIVDTRKTAMGQPQKSSYDRYDFLMFKYAFSHYVKTFKDYNTFFSVGIELSYILSQRTKLYFFDGKTTVKKNSSQISRNYFITTSPTFLCSYGIEFDKKIFNIGSGSRLSIDFTYDWYALGLITTPSNQYFGCFLNYRMLL